MRAELDASPVHLALLRVAVAGIVVLSPELYRAPELAADPSRLVSVPEGLGLVARLPITVGVARALQAIALSSAATGILGFWSRTSMSVLALSGGLLFSLSSREGAVLHDMHLFWMAALLAASPCGDAIALDAWGKPGRAATLTDGVAVSFARLFLGLVYFFPGVHKLAESGFGWASGANIVGHMHGKWLQNGAVPSLRVDHVPWLCALGGAAVIAFELSFVFLALASTKTRLVAMGMGLAFHFATARLFFVSFPSLWVCYVVLLPSAWVERLRASARVRASSAIGWRPAAVVGVVIALATIVQGIRGQTQAWPFACYPTFASRETDRAPEVVVAVTSADGTTRWLTGREHGIRSQADWGRVWRISGAYGDPPNAAALRMHASGVLATAWPPIADAVRVDVYRAEIATAPERWADVPHGGQLLLSMQP